MTIKVSGNKIQRLALVLIAAAFAASAAEARENSAAEEAVYLGVKDYGSKNVNKDHKDGFMYRFDIHGQETVFTLDNGTKNAAGKYDYPIQNTLKEGRRYIVTLNDGMVTAAEEIEDQLPPYVPAVQGTPGERTLKNFLKTALMPVGTTLYIYGGGWDWQDEGSAMSARTLGVSPDWVRFFREQDENYTYKEKNGDPAKADPAHSYYPYGEYNEYYYAGLDCSGYLGWALYNTFEAESGNEGYVVGSTGAAKRLSERGLGKWTQDMPDGQHKMKPGEIVSINGHVWISLGTCGDGSVVVLHSTPSRSRSGQPGGGVQISAIGTDESCEAYGLAERYMSRYYPEWHKRYPVYLCDPNRYFTVEGDKAGRFSWDTGRGLMDPDGLGEKRPEEVLAALFN